MPHFFKIFVCSILYLAASPLCQSTQLEDSLVYKGVLLKFYTHVTYISVHINLTYGTHFILYLYYRYGSLTWQTLIQFNYVKVLLVVSSVMFIT